MRARLVVWLPKWAHEQIPIQISHSVHRERLMMIMPLLLRYQGVKNVLYFQFGRASKKALRTRQRLQMDGPSWKFIPDVVNTSIIREVRLKMR
jgi:hypothetical protein